MFAGLRAAVKPRAVQTPITTVQTQKRYASDKAIRTRMVAVTNIKKITKAMKMVASAKVRRAEEALMTTRRFAAPLEEVLPTQAPEAVGAKVDAAARAEKFLVVAITPDRGLCGSVNGSVVRGTRGRLNHHVQVRDHVRAIGLGEKTRAGLERNFGSRLLFLIGEHSKLKRRTFKETSVFADMILSQEFDKGEFVYNNFRNLMSFDTTVAPFQSYANLVADPKLFEVYEQEGNSDLLENFYQFTFAVQLHHLFAETDMVEFSQRVNSMSSSSKNAEAMLSKLRLLYNRSRQAKITTELIEIISGATAAAEQAA